MHLTELCRRMLTTDLHGFIAEQREKLEWMSRIIPEFIRMDDDDKVTGVTFKKILAYDRKYGHTPNAKALVEFANHIDDGFPLDNQGSANLHEDIKDLSSISDEPPWGELKSQDLYVLADQAFQRIRGSVVGSCALKFNQIAMYRKPFEPKKGVELFGPEAAFAYLQQAMGTMDFQPIKRPLAGPLHIHANRIGDYLARLSGGTGSDSNMPLGYYHIDESVTVDKLDCGFIGILGEAKRGKTTLVNSIVYNWICNGKNVLYISLEHGFENLGAKLAIMHSTSVANEIGGTKGEIYKIPSLEDFKARKANDTDLCAAESIWQGIKARTHFPGVIDIQSIRSWEGIKSYLLANDCKYHYDALVVDYMRRLDLPGRADEANAAMTAIIHDAQSLSRSFMGRGIVILTPVEVNRGGSKEAGDSEVEKDFEHRWTINAIRQDTAFQYSLDLCLGVWSDDDMKETNRIEVEGVFAREGKVPHRVIMYVDERTKLVSYHPLDTHVPAPVQNWAKTWESTTDYVDDLGGNNE